MDAKRPAGRFEHVDDRRPPREGSDPGLRRAERLVVPTGTGCGHERGGRSAPAPDGADDRPVDGPGLLRPHQPRGRGGQHMPLVQGLRVSPDVEAPQDRSTAERRQDEDAGRREERERERVRDDRAHRPPGIAGHEQPERDGRRYAGRLEQTRADENPPACLRHLARVEDAHRERRVPEEEEPGETQELPSDDERGPVEVRHPVPRPEHLGAVVGHRHSRVHQESDAEDHDPPHLVGRRSACACGHDGRRRERQQVLDENGRIEGERDRRPGDARLRERDHGRARDPEREADPHAHGDHAAGEVVEPGPATDPRALAGEGPQYGRGEEVRGDVEKEEELHPRGELAEERREHLRRRHVQEKGREHELRGVRGAEEAVEAEQPRPGLAAARDEQEERGGAEPDEMVREEEGHVAVLAMVVAPEPREEEKRRGDLNRGDGAEDARAPAREGAPGRSGPGRRRVPRGVTAQDGRRYGAEIVERPAIGRSG